MDPNETLKRLRDALKVALGGNGDTIEEDRAAYDAAEAAQALDEWLSAAGFLPDAWSAAVGRGRPQSDQAWHGVARSAATGLDAL